jgi:hypothetical protein
MKAYFNEQPDVYAVSGNELRIRWNIQEVPAPSIDDTPATQWEANEALCSAFDNRNQIIEKIIGSVMDTGAEIAMINNRDTRAAEYAEYQAFRAEAKALADGWVNR